MKVTTSKAELKPGDRSESALTKIFPKPKGTEFFSRIISENYSVSRIITEK